MKKSLSQILITYLTTIVLIIQSSWQISVPYRAMGLVTQASRVVANPALIPGLAGLGAWVTSSTTEAMTIGAPEHKCEPGYTNVYGKCMKQEVTNMNIFCEDPSYTPRTVYDVNYGFPANSCVKNTNVNALVICPSGEESGGANGQQCRRSEPIIGDDRCPSGTYIDNGRCVGPWYLPQDEDSFICPPACDPSYVFPYPGAPCPAEYDPIKLSEPYRKAYCSEGAVEAGYNCKEGDELELMYPDMQPTMPEIFVPPTTTSPLRCISKDYEPQIRNCPTPNIYKPSRPQGTPMWDTPSGVDAENPAYYDEETGLPTHCTRMWVHEIIIECPEGEEYDESVGGCLNLDDVTCPEGTTFEDGQCRGGDGRQCPISKEWNELSGTCVPKITDPDSFDQVYNSGSDMGWAIGGMQSRLKQDANNSGDITLNMQLLNAEANQELQDTADSFRSVVAIGENDRTNNTYFDNLGSTYGSEVQQRKAIQTNHASYIAYDRDEDKEHPNLAAEAYLTVQGNIDGNRPPPINPNDDWLQGSQDLIRDIADGSDPYFGDCDEEGTKWVLNPDKQVVTQEKCTSPVTVNYDSCQVTRYVEQPTISVISGLDSAEIQFTAPDSIRLTVGELCDGCLEKRESETCSTHYGKVIFKVDADIKVESAVFTESYYEDMLSITLDGNEIFRKAPDPWDITGWPDKEDDCAQGAMNHWVGSEDITEEFQQSLSEDTVVELEYMIAVGSTGDANATIDIKFDQEVSTEWYDEDRYQPEGCMEKIESGQCEVEEWQCTVRRPPQTLGMELWDEWDDVNNWRITNDGYDANSILNLSSATVYGAMHDVGSIWFEGKVQVRESSDDDTFGFVFGYPEYPEFNKDPKEDSYDPSAEDSERNHFYMLLWTSRHSSSSDNKHGMKLYKSYRDYLTLNLTWGDWLHGLEEDDDFDNTVLVIENLFYSNEIWRNWQEYNIEFKHDHLGGIRYIIDGVTKIAIEGDEHHFKTGRFGFITHSQKDVYFTGMQKVLPYIWGPLYPGDSDPSECMKASTINMQCSADRPSSILTPDGIRSVDSIREQQNECSALDQATDCTWVSRECAEGYGLPDGTCTLEEMTYECIDNTEAWEEVPFANSCDVLPCQEGDDSCNTRSDQEKNSDFNQVVVESSVLTEMRHDMTCDDPKDVSTCETFRGTKRTCSYDQFGMIDCCDEFQGKTIDLFKLATNAMKVAGFADEQLGISESMSNMMWGTGNGDGWLPNDMFDTINPFTSGTNDIGDVGDAISSGNSSSWEGVGSGTANRYSTQNEVTAGNDADSPTDDKGFDAESFFLDYFKEMALDKIKETMVNYATNVVVSLMGDELKKALVGAVMGAAQDAITDELAAQALQQALGNMMVYMNMIGVAYAVVQIAIMLYKMLNGCDESEEDMAQLIKTKSCFYSHTTKCSKTLGVCKNKHRKRWCCFSSVMSKIIMEQSIKQSEAFGRSYSNREWYELKKLENGVEVDAGCRGLTVDEISEVDFDQVDFTEWYNLMVQSGSLPDSSSTLEEWTRDKHYSNPYGRSDALTRQTEDRDVGDLNENYRNVMDASDVLGDVDCNLTPDIEGCKVGIFATPAAP